MSLTAKLGLGLSLSLLLAGAQACVPRQTYDTHVSELNETIAQRDAQIADLKGVKAENDKLRAENELLKIHKDAYDELSKDIREALEGLKKEGEFEKLPSGGWSMNTDFLFRSGSWEVSPEGQKALKKFVAAFKGKDVKFRIVGHTDIDPIRATKDKIKSEMNLELGMYRAFKVVEIMHKEGVKESNMWVESHGMSDPILKPEASAAAKKKNRRVEIFVLGATPESAPPSSGSK